MSPQNPVLYVLTFAAASTLMLDACTTTNSHTREIIRRLNDGFTDGNSSYLKAETNLFALYEKELNNIEGMLKILGSNARERVNAIYSENTKKSNNQTTGAFASQNANHDYTDLAMKVLRLTQENQTATLSHVFDFEDGDQIGFCFARALLVHYLLLQHEVPQRDIFKIFALGDLKLEHQIWRFHVAVLLKSKHGPLVVDPLFEKPVPLSEWTAAIERLDIKDPFARVRFYITDPRKFLPASGAYTVENIMDPHLQEYFVALFRNLS